MYTRLPSPVSDRCRAILRPMPMMPNTRSAEMDVPDPKTVNSILVIQTKFIGDIILTSVLLRHLRAHYPAKITVLCAAGLDKFVVNHDLADAAIPISLKRMRGSPGARLAEMVKVIRTLRRHAFDMCIDITDSKTSRIMVHMLNIPARVGFFPPEKALRPWERLPVNIHAAPQGPGGEHYLHRYLSPLTALGIEIVDPVPRIKPLPGAAATAAELLAAEKLSRGAFVAMHAGASFEGRCWQPERFAATADAIFQRTGLRTLVVGGPDEVGIAERVLSAAKSPVASIVGKASLETLAAVLSHASAFIGNESGPMHMAAAVGTPVLGLFGLTAPKVWGPLGANGIAVQPSMPCPCINPGVCKPNTPGRVYCVQRLEVDVVVEAAFGLLGVIGVGEQRTP